MKILALILATLMALASPAIAQPKPPTGYNTGMPFGLIGPKELDHLTAYAQKEGADLMGDMNLAYQKDEAALARVFSFSLKFKKLDRDAKAYGQLIYSSFLNLGEAYGVEKFSRLVAAQPEVVRQRIRDFIYYDATQAPKKIRAEAEAGARKGAPLLFPGDYVFGAGNDIFRES
ncbi:MAG: hypothetical protein HYV95_16460 [Opitutae bacterium]|nr:hypothetical protein [Opitutae bacterium]